MNFCSPLKKLLLALGVLAVMAAQLFGVGHGFLCDCSGQPEFTLSDHCHGPHGADCHENDEPFHFEDSHPESSDTHAHTRITQDFRSTHSLAAVLTVAEPLLQVTFVLNDAAWENAAAIRTWKYLAEERGSSPCGVAVSRTVVLLI